MPTLPFHVLSCSPLQVGKGRRQERLETEQKSLFSGGFTPPSLELVEVVFPLMRACVGNQRSSPGNTLCTTLGYNLVSLLASCVGSLWPRLSSKVGHNDGVWA